MRRRIVLLLAPAALALAASLAHARAVTGVVVDRRGTPIEFASVRVPALARGAATDEQGRFSIDLPDGAVTLDVSQIGYQHARVTLTVGEALAPLRVALADEPVPVAEVTVAASSFGKTGKSEGAVVRRDDVYMTPGGAGDIFQSLRALPGINAPAEGAALYVRGGAPNETAIRIDGADIGHPYHYEGASGGLFSILDTYMLKSAFFSSGGFGARYGGAMSGVLDVETQDPMNLRTLTVGANMAGGGFSSTWALVPDRVSLLVSMQQSVPDLLMKLYGGSQDYTQFPWSENGVAKLIWRYSATGHLAVFGIGSVEHLGAKVDVLNSRDVYASNARNEFGAVHLRDALLGHGAITANATLQHWRNAWSWSAFGTTTREHVSGADVHVVWPLGPRHELSAGGVWRRDAREDRGTMAADSTDLVDQPPVRLLHTLTTTREPGVYLEDKLRLAGPVYATIGARADYDGDDATWSLDPRGALAWRVDEHQTLRVAGGRYRQPPDPSLTDPRWGNPLLAAPYADHVIAGYEWKSDFGNVRLEGYDKRYHRLPLVDREHWYEGRGTGHARGVDVFVQGTWRDLNGWVSYGWLDAKRRQMDDAVESPELNSVKHSLTLVGQYHINMRWSTGLRWTHTSGRPFTPVVGATYDPVRRFWRPVYGAHGSALMPAYDRADLRLMRLFSLPRLGRLPASGTCVAYVEGLNMLGQRNVLEYTYSFDYKRRYATESYFGRRMLVAGFSTTW